MRNKSRRIFKLSRAGVARLLMILVFGVIAVRLFDIQIINHDKYVTLAEVKQKMQSVVLAKRGEIYMMDGDEPVPVVMNEKVWTVIVDPMLANEEKVAKVIDQYVEKKTAEWSKVFANKNSRYFVVARNVKREAAEKIKEAKLGGVWLQAGTNRVYPEGEMASALLGFVNADNVGQYGVEGALDKELKGEDGVLKTVKDVNNIPLTIGEDNVRVPAVDGKNIVLTIDRNVQNAVEKALAQALDRYKVTNASAMVMEPKTGAILAMANLPNYDPANYSMVENAEIYQNGVVTDAYEPASVCKTFAFAVGIDRGVVTPITTFYNTDLTVVDGWPIGNVSKGHLGNITMQTALSWSLNTGSTQVLRLLGGSETEINFQGKQILYDYYKNKFKLGEITGVELPESAGIIIAPDSIDGTNARYANMTFGQGLNLTMIQIAAAFSAVVNGGDYLVPTVVAGELKDGKLIKKELAKPVMQSIRSDTSKTMREMLLKARRLYVGTEQFDQGLYIGGKTGTAQTIRNGKYVMDETIGSYVGFGSESLDQLPEYVIITKIWSKGRTMQGGDAKSIFDDISKYMNEYLRMKKNDQ